MRHPTTIAAVLVATAFLSKPAGAQTARATVEVAATVVETAGAHVDALAATLTETDGGVRLTAPLRVSGAGSPGVAVASGAGERECQAVPSVDGRARGEPGTAPWLHCFVPRRAAHSGGVTEIAVTLVVVPAT
jgi:hypothetical protein